MKNEFVCGFGIAMADMMRVHPDDVVAHDVIVGAGYNMKSFIDAGLEEYDLRELRIAFSDGMEE